MLEIARSLVGFTNFGIEEESSVDLGLQVTVLELWVTDLGDIVFGDNFVIMDINPKNECRYSLCFSACFFLRMQWPNSSIGAIETKE